MKTFKSQKYLAVPAIALVALLAGCASKNMARLKDPQYVEQSENLLTPLRSQYQDLASGPAPLIAPTNFQEASEAYNKARDLASKGADIGRLGEAAQVASEKIKSASSRTDAQKDFFKTALDARAEAIKTGAAARTASALRQLDSDFASENARAERGFPLNNKDVADIASRYQNLSAQAALFTLEQAKQRLQVMENAGANKLIPLRLAEVKKHIIASESFIKSAPSDQLGQKERLADLDRDMQTAYVQLQIAKQISTLRPEEMALQIDGAITRLEKAASIPASETQPLETLGWQTRLNRVVEKTEVALQAERKLEDKEHQLSQTEQKLKKISGSADLADKMKRAESSFDPKDVQVSLSGSNLVLRLKNLTFLSGKADIKPQNFDLLSKVGNLIRDLKPAAVTVEGHTDSAGTADLNRALSEERAKAVADYFASLQPLKNLTIQSEGYGFDKPVASNKTKEGRALNRSVAVILKFTE